MIKSGFLFIRSAILSEVTITLDDYLKANPEVKDLPRWGIEPQSLDPQAVVIAMSYGNPFCLTVYPMEYTKLMKSSWHNKTFSVMHLSNFFIIFMFIIWLDMFQIQRKYLYSIVYSLLWLSNKLGKSVWQTKLDLKEHLTIEFVPLFHC